MFGTKPLTLRENLGRGCARMVAEGGIWAYEGGSDRTLEEISLLGAS